MNVLYVSHVKYVTKNHSLHYVNKIIVPILVAILNLPPFLLELQNFWESLSKVFSNNYF